MIGLESDKKVIFIKLQEYPILPTVCCCPVTKSSNSGKADRKISVFLRLPYSEHDVNGSFHTRIGYSDFFAFQYAVRFMRINRLFVNWKKKRKKYAHIWISAHSNKPNMRITHEYKLQIWKIYAPFSLNSNMGM